MTDHLTCSDCGSVIGIDDTQVFMPTGAAYCGDCWPARRAYLATVRTGLRAQAKKRGK